ncbi:MAG: hypothetical protein H8D42_03570 [Candidatus Marinimicrobia bacterium]|nr:hypothetical protein [Candidatus Neomarinimicrobiota bacterium]
MEHNEYHKQRLKGADQIAEKAHQLARKGGISLESCVWDHGREIVDRDKHTLAISSGGKTARGEFPDEWLADYPGKVGTEKADAVLREMIRSVL